MNQHFNFAGGRRLGRSALALTMACTGIVLAGTGCGRTLTITQMDYINTAVQFGRTSGELTGEPLEVNVVCVHPHDLDNDLNSLLDPKQSITSDLWYKHRPRPGDKIEDEGHDRMRLPANQIFLLTDEKQCYGVRKGPWLRGAIVDKRKKVPVRFDFGPNLHDRRSVIYVFPKFIDAKGETLPVPPVKFHPPGDYKEQLFVEIGVDENRDNHGQYIDQKTERKLGRKSE